MFIDTLFCYSVNVNILSNINNNKCHGSNIPSFKFFKSSLFELFEAHLHLNYPNLNVHLNYSKFNVHLNYSAFKFHLNFRHSDFHFNYSTTALDLMFKKSNIEYQMLKISGR